MTTVMSYTDASAAELFNSGDTYSDAVFGTPITGGNIIMGAEQGWIGPSDPFYHVEESFTRYAYTLDSDSHVVSAHFEFTGYLAGGTPARHLEIREYDWGTSVTPADWRTPSQLSALTMLAMLDNIQGATTGGKWRASSPLLLSRLFTTGEVRVVCNSSRHRQQIAPTASSSVKEWIGFYGPDAEAGTVWDPVLIYTTAPISTLHRVLGAQVQLSDGTHAFLEATASVTAPTILLRHHDGTTITTVDTLPTGGSPATAFGVDRPSGLQNIALVRDAADNLYVIGRAGHGGLPEWRFLARAYIKGPGHTWLAQLLMLDTAIGDYGHITQVAATWHSSGGTAGTILAVFSHSGYIRDQWIAQQWWALLNCDSLLAGFGTLKRAVGFPETLFSTPALGIDPVKYHNLTGTGVDVAAIGGTRGFAVAYNRNAGLGGVGNVSQSRYTLGSAATSIINTGQRDGVPHATRDANSKLRVIAINDTTYAVIGVSAAATVGPRVVFLENIGASGVTTVIGDVTLSDEGIASLPSASTLATSAAWDVMHDPARNKLWFYYFDTANAQRLMRTGIDLVDKLADQSEIQVSAAVGAGGSTQRAMRVHRGPMVGSTVLISVANRTSGGVHSTVYVLDQFNAAPLGPTLTPMSNFDADLDRTFSWTFNDPNPGDTQSAYELEINTSLGVSVLDTGKVTSASSSRLVPGATLTNPGSWQWRVKTWDVLDTEGAWSEFATFDTAEGGTVTITSPSVDNPDPNNVAAWTIQWSVAGSTQDSYRVVVVNNATGEQLSTSGWVASTATSYDVLLPTGIEWRVEVTARDNGVETNTAVRLITPDYGTPEIPTIDVLEQPDDGHIQIVITNPESTGDRPEVVLNEIYRRVLDTTGAYTLAGTTVHNGTYLDYGVASGTEYQYFVRGVTAD